MANYYISSVGYAAVAQFAINTAYVSTSNGGRGDYIRKLGAETVGNERVHRCTTSGTSGGAEAAWNLTNHATTTQGTAVFTECTADEAEQVAGNWKAPGARLSLLNSTKGTSGDTFFVSSDHAETVATSLNFSYSGVAAGPMKFISVTRTAGSIPPVTADYTVGASVNSTGGALTISPPTNTPYRFFGIAFKSSTSITLDNNQSMQFDDCNFNLNNATGASRINLANGSSGFRIRLNNTTATFGSASQAIAISTASGSAPNVDIVWSNTPSAILGTVPTTLFSNSAQSGEISIRGVDLSAVTGNLVSGNITAGAAKMRFANCLLAAGVVPMTGTPPVALGTSATVFLDNCDDTTGNTNYRFAWYMSGGIVAQDILVVRTGGATDGVTPQSWKVTTNTTGPPTLFMPQELPPIARRYNTTGSVTATIYFVTDTAAVLDNSQIWMDVEGLTNSGSPLSTLSSDRIADLIPGTSVSGHSSDTSAWDTGAAARQDNHAYSVGDVFKTATAPGQIFRVTTAGTSATSEPAAYTGVTDGTQITTDRNGGGMVVRCMVRQKLTKTFTLQKKGVVFAAPRLATATLVAYIDPNLNLA